MPEYGDDEEWILTCGHYFYYDSTLPRNILQHKNLGYLPPEVQRLQYINIRISGTGVTQLNDIVLITNVLFY